jgi:hypothetical protein
MDDVGESDDNDNNSNSDDNEDDNDEVPRGLDSTLNGPH